MPIVVSFVRSEKHDKFDKYDKPHYASRFRGCQSSCRLSGLIKSQTRRRGSRNPRIDPRKSQTQVFQISSESAHDPDGIHMGFERTSNDDIWDKYFESL